MCNILKYSYESIKSCRMSHILGTLRKIKFYHNDSYLNYNYINKDKVSIILPVYNQADMISESIEGILTQTYENFELIIVNDGSTDNIEEVMSKFSYDSRIKFITQKNQKLPMALNTGFYFATGNYYTWTSADNIMLPNQMEVLVNYLASHDDVGMVFSDYQVIDEEGNPYRNPEFRIQNQLDDDISLMKLPDTITYENFLDIPDNFIGASFMYKKNVAKIIGEYTNDTFGGEDYDYWLRIFNLFPIHHINEILYKYRVHSNTLSSKAKELSLDINISRLLKRAKGRRSFSSEKIEFIQEVENYLLPNKSSQFKVYVYYNNFIVEDENNFNILVINQNNLNIVSTSLNNYDLIICSDKDIYATLDVNRKYKYLIIFLDLNYNLNEFVKIVKNAFFDRLNLSKQDNMLHVSRNSMVQHTIEFFDDSKIGVL